MNDAEAEAERVLRENLQVRALSPEALERIRRVTETEWRANVETTTRRGWRTFAAAAGVAMLDVAGSWAFWMRGAAAPAEPLAKVMRSEAPGVVELRSLGRESPVAVGAMLLAGRQFAVRGGTLLELQGGGNLRIAP